MKLDKNKHYGHVYGHSDALFEQNGVLFDGAGDPIESQQTTSKKKVVTAVEKFDDKAAKFLSDLLKEGPITKSNIYREAEQAGIDWNSVRDASVNLNIHVYKQKSTEYWRLSEKVAA